MTNSVAVRMYNVGFGDAFVVTVKRSRKQWKMLVDCGVHSQGRARPIDEAVDAIIADLKAASPDGVPHLDVVVATHRHADHIAGFALDAWEQVTVGEVWVPFTENDDDPAATRLREAQSLAAQRLVALSAAPSLALANALALNSLGNDDAMDRLLCRNGRGFATKPHVRYLPSVTPEENVVATTIPDVRVHVLGPSRDPKHLKRMHPPAHAGWLRLGDTDLLADDVVDGKPRPLFNPMYAVDESQVPPDLVHAKSRLAEHPPGNDAGVLAAASVLERCVNNTSVFLVLDANGTRLVFPGDAQQGAWDHVLDDPATRKLVSAPAFYKIGHHGSHNATPKPYVEQVLGNGAYAMLPWGKVEQWKKIPKAELITALHEKGCHIVRADAPVAEPGHVEVHDDLWSEVTFAV